MNMKLSSALPFLSWLRATTPQTIRADFLAGITGAVIVVPQGLAFATIAGLPPEYGLYTAMITPIIAALFGSSFHLISGPTTAISIVVFSAISHHAEPGTPEFVSLALTLTFLAGIYQLAFGLARFGALVNFVSYTVVIGFTAGAALLIATTQFANVTGIFVPRGETFAHTWVDLYQGMDQLNGYLLLIALVTLITAVAAKRFIPKAPYLLIGMLFGSLVAVAISGSVDGIEWVGPTPAHLPPVSLHDLSFATIKVLAPEAFAVALLGLIEAVAISRAIATNTDQRIDANQEFIGQGLSNIGGSFLSSYAGSGSFTRSGVNYEAGAQTPLSAIFAAIMLMALVVLIAPLTAYLPEAAMSAIILLVAYNLIDFRHIYQILTFSKSESAIFLTTFFSTLLLELEFAIYLGMLISLVLFLAKTSTPEIPTMTIESESSVAKRKFVSLERKSLPECPQLKIIRIDMSVYFGSTGHIQERISRIVDREGIKHILIVSSGINFIDLAGTRALTQESKRLRRMGGGLYFVGLKLSVYQLAVNVHFIEEIGSQNFFDSKAKAIQSIFERLDRDVCQSCDLRIFRECRSIPGTEA